MKFIHIQKINNFLKEEEKDKLRVCIQLILIIIGLLNISCAGALKENLAIIIGIATINIAIISLIRNIIKKEYKSIYKYKIPENIVNIILGIMMLLNQNNAIAFIAIAWGIYGLRKGIIGINIAIFKKQKNKKCIFKLIHAIIETILSLLLLFDPFEKVEEHIILLGFEMIIRAVKIGSYNEKLNEE